MEEELQPFSVVWKLGLGTRHGRVGRACCSLQNQSAAPTRAHSQKGGLSPFPRSTVLRVVLLKSALMMLDPSLAPHVLRLRCLGPLLDSERKLETTSNCPREEPQSPSHPVPA